MRKKTHARARRAVEPPVSEYGVRQRMSRMPERYVEIAWWQTQRVAVAARRLATGVADV